VKKKEESHVKIAVL